MTQEFPVDPAEGIDKNPSPPSVRETDSEKAERVRDSIGKLSETRLAADAPMDQLRNRVGVLRRQLLEAIEEEKKVRIERARLSRRHDGLRGHHLDLQRLRLQKMSEQAQIGSKLKALAEGTDSSAKGELTRLEERVRELTGEVSAFKETLVMHRRDRDRVFDRIIQAWESLQDLLTEQLLTKILIFESSPEELKGGSGLCGVIAEFLGRLLVLEKEGAHLAGMLRRMYPLGSG